MIELLCNPSNYSKGRKSKIKYIVIHYTANNGDTAINNGKYFQRPNRNASAHIFIDEYKSILSVKEHDTAWHCGTRGAYKHPKCRNNNSIGIELCTRRDSKGVFYVPSKVLNNLLYRVKILMKKYNIPIENILRHFDITGKNCPAPFVENEKSWINFLNELKEKEKEIKNTRSISYKNKKANLEYMIKDETTYYKLRDICNLLNKDVIYNEHTKEILIKD